MAIDPTTLLGPDGARLGAEVAAASGRTSVARWVREGRLLRPLPGVLVDPSRSGHWRTRAATAALWTRGRLTGRSALYLSDLVSEPGARVHAAVSPARHIAVPRPPWLTVHVSPDVTGVLRQGLLVTHVLRALADTWGWAHGSRGTPRDIEIARGAVIGAIRRGRVRADEFSADLESRVNLPGRAALLELIALVAAGSHSEFEIWGLTNVLDVPGLPAVELQYPLQTAIGLIHFDAALPAARLGIELDGAAYHRSPDAWARDRRRDAAVLAEDWAALRIDFRRSHDDRRAAQAEIAAAYNARIARISPFPPRS